MGRFSLSAVAFSRLAARGLRRLDRVARRPRETQERVLRGLLRRAAETEYGRAHGFSDIRSAAEYEARVPLRSYEPMRLLWERVMDGATDVTWPGRIRYFAITSGTTSGLKYMPVSRAMVKSSRRSAGNLLALYFRQSGDARFLSGKFFYLGGSTTLRRRGQALYGDSSGIMTRHVPFFARRYHLPWPEHAKLEDWEEKIPVFATHYLREPVRVISTLPSWCTLFFAELIQQAQARLSSSIQTVGEIWPDLKALVSYGMALAPYRQRLEDQIGRRILFIDTYSSSEGGMNAIQDRQDDPGMLLTLDNGIFYEFIPFEQMDREQPDRLPIWEVERDRTYEIVLSTNAGAWAYRIGDLVKFVSTAPYRLVVAGRTQILLNTFGEHVILEEMEGAMEAASRETGAQVADYTVESVVRSEDNRPGYHRWLIEFTQAPDDLDRFGTLLDEFIRSKNVDYDTHRQNDFGMLPPQMVPLSPGTFYEWMKQEGKLGGQHKVPRVPRKATMVEELSRISARLKPSQ